ncbi:unnamed protein product [Arctia plantaginis]|uniref:Uncharacterized protein n=1 Tax=Arctia plantaginis TaxID=874455 RepID=A0A8S0YZ68_ARCPL|nr:unnamed protein product [Arctia plantaginis]
MWKCSVTEVDRSSRSLMYEYMFKELRHSADAETLTTVYVSLCQSIIPYCIPVRGGTYKTVKLDAERAQRAVLKVMLFKRRDYATSQLYSDTRVLTVRKLYILRIVLRRHSMLPLKVNLLQRRVGFPVCDLSHTGNPWRMHILQSTYCKVRLVLHLPVDNS